MVLDRLNFLKNNKEKKEEEGSYNSGTLFEVKNLIGDTENVSIPKKKLSNDLKKSEENEEILNLVINNGGRMGTTDLLNHCTSNNIFSRATFFRKIRTLLKNNKIKKVKEGRKSFYQIV